MAKSGIVAGSTNSKRSGYDVWGYIVEIGHGVYWGELADIGGYVIIPLSTDKHA